MLIVPPFPTGALALLWRYKSLVGIALLALALVISRVQLNSARDKLEECKAARVADRIAYKAAQDKAREQMRAENKRIEAEQEQINDRVEADLNARIERLRRELRAETAKGRAGSGGASGVSPAPQGAAGEARVCFAPDVVLRAAENEERHEQLIRWVEEQLKVKR